MSKDKKNLGGEMKRIYAVWQARHNEKTDHKDRCYMPLGYGLKDRKTVIDLKLILNRVPDYATIIKAKNIEEACEIHILSNLPDNLK